MFEEVEVRAAFDRASSLVVSDRADIGHLWKVALIETHIDTLALFGIDLGDILATFAGSNPLGQVPEPTLLGLPC